MLGEEVGEEGEGEPEADQDVRDVDAGEDEDAEAGENDKASVEAGPGGGEGVAGEGFEQQGEREDCEGERDARGCGGGAKELHAGGHRPVVERGFFEVADAVGVERDVVVAEEHLAGDFGVDGVGVVQQGRGEEGEGGVEDEPEEQQDEAIARGARAGGEHLL